MTRDEAIKRLIILKHVQANLKDKEALTIAINSLTVDAKYDLLHEDGEDKDDRDN